ncbi:MAG: flagellar motor protein MotB [Elusimicrobiota bacterium]
MIPFLHRLPAASQEENPLWLIVLADMMTNLMLFFLVMFALAQQAPSARAQWAKSFDAADVVDTHPRPEDAAAARDFAEKQAAAKLKTIFPDTDVTERLVRVRLQNKILFPSALSNLEPEADEPISKLARILRDMPNTVIIEGHTDDVPLTKSPYRSNWELSVARSNSVIQKLVADAVPPERLVAAGYGEFRPVAPNDSVENRARNRRVEILILRGKGDADE